VDRLETLDSSNHRTVRRVYDRNVLRYDASAFFDPKKHGKGVIKERRVCTCVCDDELFRVAFLQLLRLRCIAILSLFSVLY